MNDRTRLTLAPDAHRATRHATALPSAPARCHDMTMPALPSSPRMIGRHSELAALLEAFDDGTGGRPRTVVVRGEAGVGKTRLVQEFLALVATDHFEAGHPSPASAEEGDAAPVVAFGQCVEIGPIGAPFGPIRRVLRDLHDAVGTDALREAAGSAAAIASLAALVPGIAETTAEHDDPAGAFAEAIEVLLEGLSRRRHVVVVLEDLQWADAATMALLKTLASTLRVAGSRSSRPTAPTTSIASIRSGRCSPSSTARAPSSASRRRPSAPRRSPSRSRSWRDGLDPRVVEALAERSGGIPFLVEELVDLGDRALPDTLRELVLARYARLGDDGQQVVRTMAAGGMHVDHDVLAAVAPLDESALDLAVREAIDTRVSLADGAGYSFRHALTREAVHGEMLPSERVRVHRRYAEYLARPRRRLPRRRVSAVAEHWLAARDLPPRSMRRSSRCAQSRIPASRRRPRPSSPSVSRSCGRRFRMPKIERARAARAFHLDAAQAWHDLGDPERSLRSANEGLAVCPDDPLRGPR